jgi:GH35 family endo-1,4-beta-xylanase
VPNVYLSIGNSDDKLTQREWAQFITRVRAAITGWACQVHGSWFSAPDSMWQNANWCLEFDTEADMKYAREAIITIRRQYRQDSVAWAVADPEFI